MPSRCTSSGLHHGIRRALAASAALVVLAAILIAPAGAEARASYVIVGHGYGHGVGLSQWGAYGLAKHGRGYRAIATHYYRGTKVGMVRAGRTLRVLLGAEAGGVRFRGSRRACGHDLKPARAYRAALRGGRVQLRRGNGKRIAGCGRKLVAKPAGATLRIGGQGRYRGELLAAASGGQLLVVNQVGIEGYARGVLANEMPASWPLDALRAQALATRSYALATGGRDRWFDLYDDTRSQVYGGVATEQKRTNRAVRTSRRQVLRYRGDVIPAFFSSSSGGRTASVQFGFPGASPKPYLTSVRDPFDDASPYHRWRVRMSRSEIESRLSGLLKGRFRGVRITKRGDSPRIVTARIRGTGGGTAVSGATLRDRLGLRSTWFKVKRR